MRIFFLRSVWILLAAACFFAGLFVHLWPTLKIDPKITVGEIFQAIVTLVLAIVVSRWWKAVESRNESGKRLLIELLGEARRMSGELRTDFLMLCDCDWNDQTYSRIVRGFRNLSNCIREVEIISDEIFRDDPCSDLRKNFIELKKGMTSIVPRQAVTQIEAAEAETACSKFRMTLAVAQAHVVKY